MIFVFYIFFIILVVFSYNGLVHKLCIKREIPEERRPGIFRTINILMTIWLISSYVKLFINV